MKKDHTQIIKEFRGMKAEVWKLFFIIIGLLLLTITLTAAIL